MEIKFRVFDGEKILYGAEENNGVWRTFQFYEDGAYEVIEIQHKNGIPCGDETTIVSEKIMQYTGIKDKNGKEIYEGDIIKTECNSIFITKWVNFSASFRYSDIKNGLGDIDSESMSNYDYVEIIGNIYENPELINSL